MPAARLSASDYVVLGMLAAHGPGTPYDLKRWVDVSVGNFWKFPRAQLYVAPERLARLGLLEEVREQSGRHRRRFSVNEAGRATLREWLRQPEVDPPEVRDPGLLKLYFSAVADRADVVNLARRQVEVHAAKLAVYERIHARISPDPRAAYARATLDFGIAVARAAVGFWERIAESPPG